MEKILFKEEQKFSNPGLWVFVAVVFTFALAPIAVELYNHLVLHEPVSGEDTSIRGLIVLIVLLVALLLLTFLLFKTMKLVVEVRKDGIYYSYPPFILKARSLAKTEIGKYKIRKYRPILDYSGWGIRTSWGGAGRAYNVKGNIGLQLYLKDGKKVLFGTQRAEALLRAMHKMMKEE